MTKLTADQIYEAYRMKMIDGATVKEITVKTGITGTNIYSVFNTVPKYLTKRPPRAYILDSPPPRFPGYDRRRVRRGQPAVRGA